ncbi:MAG TPA: tryptophan-rich sensory protein [Arachnia sp.]|nr:tryptophan-rich sensory protein [Arachnia sp.]HMT86096.1 tryptophan-rich sensory protein [Arachnia sp.]
MRPTVRRQIAVLILLLAIVAAIAFFGSLATAPNVDGWYADAAKVAWNPPNWVFAPAWTTLYVMIAVAGFLIWRAGHDREAGRNRARGALVVYGIQLVLNAVWTPIFFAGYPLIGEAAWWVALVVIVWLIGVVIWLVVAASRWSAPAAWLLIPYLGWLIYAASLNAGIIALN